MGTAQQEDFPSPFAKSATHSSKPSQQFSRQVQQPEMPLAPSTYNHSFSPNPNAFWEPLHAGADDYLNTVQTRASKDEPKDMFCDTSDLFKSFTMDIPEDPLPCSTDQSAHDNRTESIDQQRPFESPTISNASSSSPESEDNISNSHLCMPYSASTSRAQITASLTACSCLEQHSRLLCHLKSTEQQQRTASTLDVVLIAVQNSVQTWRSMIHCHLCPYDDDRTVLLLSIMTMRSMLGCFQRLCVPTDEEHGQSEVNSPALGAVRLGNYEATKHEQALVTQLLIVRALGKIKYALVSLKDKVVLPRRQRADAGLANEHHASLAHPQVDVEYITQLLQSLIGTAQAASDAAGRTDNAVLDGVGNGIPCPGKQ